MRKKNTKNLRNFPVFFAGFCSKATSESTRYFRCLSTSKKDSCSAAFRWVPQCRQKSIRGRSKMTSASDFRSPDPSPWPKWSHTLGLKPRPPKLRHQVLPTPSHYPLADVIFGWPLIISLGSQFPTKQMREVVFRAVFLLSMGLLWELTYEGIEKVGQIHQVMFFAVFFSTLTDWWCVVCKKFI